MTNHDQAQQTSAHSHEDKSDPEAHGFKPGIAGLFALAGFQKKRLALSAFLAVIGEGAGIAIFFIIYLVVAQIADKTASAVTPPAYQLMIAVGVGAVVLKHLGKAASTSLSHIAAFNILYELRIMLLNKLLRMPLGYFSKRNSGETKKILSEDVERIELFLAHNIPEFTGAVVYLVLALTILFSVDFGMALAALAALPVGIVAQLLAARKAGGFTEKWLIAEDRMNSAMIQYIQGMPIIKAFNHSAASFGQYASAIEECVELEDRMGRIWLIPMSIFMVSLTANLVFIMPVGAIMYLNGSLSIETFVFFLIMGIGLGSPLAVLVQFFKQIQCNLEGWERIAGLLNSRSFKKPEKYLMPGNGVNGRAVEFGYDDQNKVIQGIDFSVAKGGFIALVGPSGAGKSTLARLIPRFWEVKDGSICLGSSDIRRIREETLMDAVGFVFQNVYLFNGSIEDNIKVGNPQASDEQIAAALQKARCWEFINEFPQGLDTKVGERGSRLSGGQKQRLSIARAILKDAPILILDEATAFIDPENENLIQEAINQLVQDKTLIIIAHRISTVTEADQILVLQQGRIVEKGTHEQLVRRDGLYRKMWEAHMAANTWRFKKSQAEAAS